MTLPRTSRLAAFAFGLLVLTSGCQSLEDGAKDELSQSISCPKASIEARERKDVQPYALRNHGTAQPPAEVKADAARLAVWQKKQDDIRDSYNNSETVIEARGCGHEVIYSCTRANTGRSSGAVMCFAEEYPPGVAKW